MAALAAEVREERVLLLRRLANLTSQDDDDVDSAVSRYEAALVGAVKGGVSVPPPEEDNPPQSRWNVLQAVFFASTVLTTIGQWLALSLCLLCDVWHRAVLFRAPYSPRGCVLRYCPSRATVCLSV